MVELSRLLDSNPVRFDTAILQGRLTGLRRHFETALKFAQTPVEQAITHIYLEQWQAAREIIASNPAGSAEDKAFIYYSLAQQSSAGQLAMESFERALSYYRIAEDPRGMGDSLFQLARLTATTDQEQAIVQAQRAIRVLQAAGARQQVSFIQSWIDSL
jgi:excinuclease UvrABC nuclease subunit